MRLALLANPGSGAEDRVERVTTALRAAGAEVLDVEMASFCDGPEAIDRSRLEREAERLEGVDRVVVAGGDGSVGPCAALAARAGVPLAVVPTGTANDFARFLGVPLEVEEAVRLAGDPSAGIRRLELADAAGRRPFVNAASTGLSVLAARNAHPLKPRLGRLAYAAGALRAGVRGQPLDVVVRCDGDVAFRGPAWQVVVAATGAFGGGSGTGGVDQHDHRLDVAVVEAGSRVKLVRRAWAMRGGRLVDDPGVRHLRGRTVEIEGGGVFNVDGEVMDVAPARFTVVGSVEVVVP